MGINEHEIVDEYRFILDSGWDLEKAMGGWSLVTQSEQYKNFEKAGYLRMIHKTEVE